MSPQDKSERIIQIANEALAEKGWVAPVDILIGLGILDPSHLNAWRKGMTPYLERVIQSSLPKISARLKFFRQWAIKNGLKASRTVYVAHTRKREPLRFSKSGAKHLEDQYSTHYISPLLHSKKHGEKGNATKLKKVKEPDILCYILITDRECSKCKIELEKGSFVFLEGNEALCLKCAELDHMSFLSSGNQKLTLRARKYSSISIVVLRFSRTRERYERQGILVTKEALSQAEEECKDN